MANTPGDSMKILLTSSVFAAICMTLAACVPLKQYREELTFSSQAIDCDTRTEPRLCAAGFTVPDSSYRLGIVEFDDQGEIFSPEQLEFVRADVASSNGSNAYQGKIVIVFAHGWFNDASPGNKNLEFFREMIAVLARDEVAVAKSEQRKPRVVNGVFLAWRGASSDTWPFEYATFWNRKDAAHRIGERRATEVILKLRDAAYATSSDNPMTRNRFILMGHSFGGAVIFSATSQLIADGLLKQDDPKRLNPPLADAVLLFNPAFEAARVRHLFDTAQALKNRLPTLTIFTSKSDTATGSAFPTARFINTLLVKYRTDVPNPVRSGSPVSQRTEDTRTIGHFDPFITHDMVLATTTGPCKWQSDDEGSGKAVALPGKMETTLSGEEIAATAANGIDRITKAYDASSQILDFGESCLIARAGLDQRQMAVLNISMDADIWDGHGLLQNDDRRRRFTAFLEHYIPFSARYKKGDDEALAITSDVKRDVIDRRHRAKF